MQHLFLNFAPLCVVRAARRVPSQPPRQHQPQPQPQPLWLIALTTTTKYALLQLAPLPNHHIWVVSSCVCRKGTSLAWCFQKVSARLIGVCQTVTQTQRLLSLLNAKRQPPPLQQPQQLRQRQLQPLPQLPLPQQPRRLLHTTATMTRTARVVTPPAMACVVFVKTLCIYLTASVLHLWRAQRQGNSLSVTGKQAGFALEAVRHVLENKAARHHNQPQDLTV